MAKIINNLTPAAAVEATILFGAVNPTFDSVVVCNTGADTTFSFAIRTDDETGGYFYSGETIEGGRTITLNYYLTIKKTDKVLVSSASGDVEFTIIG